MRDVEEDEDGGPLQPDNLQYLEPFITALGEDDAARLFLVVGGSQVYLPEKPRQNSTTLIVRTIGVDALARLRARIGYGYVKVPLARGWTCGFLYCKGLSENLIARIIRIDVATVRRFLKGSGLGDYRPANPDPAWQDVAQWRRDLFDWRPIANNDNDAAVIEP